MSAVTLYVPAAIASSPTVSSDFQSARKASLGESVAVSGLS